MFLAVQIFHGMNYLYPTMLQFLFVGGALCSSISSPIMGASCLAISGQIVQGSMSDQKSVDSMLCLMFSFCLSCLSA